MLERMGELALMPGWRDGKGESRSGTWCLSFCKVNMELPYPRQMHPWAGVPETRKHMLLQNGVHSVRHSSDHNNQTLGTSCPAGIGWWNQLWPNRLSLDYYLALKRNRWQPPGRSRGPHAACVSAQRPEAELSGGFLGTRAWRPVNPEKQRKKMTLWVEQACSLVTVVGP